MNEKFKLSKFKHREDVKKNSPVYSSCIICTDLSWSGWRLLVCGLSRLAAGEVDRQLRPDPAPARSRW